MNANFKDKTIREVYQIYGRSKTLKKLSYFLTEPMEKIVRELFFDVNQKKIKDWQEIVKRLNEESESKQEIIIRKLDGFLQIRQDENKPAIAIGSGNAEVVLRCDGPINIGAKQVVERNNLVGGSGVNFAHRLLADKRPVFPILPVVVKCPSDT